MLTQPQVQPSPFTFSTSLLRDEKNKTMHFVANLFIQMGKVPIFEDLLPVLWHNWCHLYSDIFDYFIPLLLLAPFKRLCLSTTVTDYNHGLQTRWLVCGQNTEHSVFYFSPGRWSWHGTKSVHHLQNVWALSVLPISLRRNVCAPCDVTGGMFSALYERFDIVQ